MQRADALREIRKLIGQDLRPLANTYGVTVWTNGKKNKGWAGHTIEHYLGLPMNSSRSPNFGSWELKVIPLVAANDPTGIRVKETMAITMIDPFTVKQNTFKESHLYRKLRKMVIVARVWENQQETRSIVHGVATFDLDNPDIYNHVKADYDLVRQTIINDGFEALSGSMGELIQPRTKGAGHGSTSRAFYARTQFVAYMLGLRATFKR